MAFEGVRPGPRERLRWAPRWPASFAGAKPSGWGLGSSVSTKGAAGRGGRRGDASTCGSLARGIGVEGARDRLLLQGRTDLLGQLEGWNPPRLPIAGGALIARGLPAGPIVAATLHNVERRWVDEGFPGEDRVREIAEEEVRAAR